MRANDLTDLARRLDAAASDAPVCLTLTLPTHRHAPDNAQDPVVLRRLVADAKQAVEAHGPDRADRIALTRRLDDLHDAVAEEVDWNHTNLGLACYLAPDLTEVVSLGHAPPARVVAGTGFHLASVIADVSSADDIDVIVLSTGGGDTEGARLYHLEHGELVEVGTSAEYDIRDRADRLTPVQKRSTSLERRLTEDFMRRFDDEVTEAFGSDHDRRIVLCGTRRLRDMWRGVARPVHTGAVIAEVDGNQDRVPEQRLIELVTEAAEEAARTRVLERISALDAVPTARLAISNQDLLAAAAAGTVAELFSEEGAVDEVEVDGVVLEDRVASIVRAAWDTRATITIAPPGSLARYDGVVGVLRYAT